ncbi:MAG: hypothetical protein J6C98_04740 [Oscillospiraceae bacterium]|nr:hypothetical protein [Oscillospiraceae bacterium]
MAYRIDYGPQGIEHRGSGKGILRIQIMTAAFLLLFILAVRHQWPDGAKKMRECLLPGGEVHEAAFTEFVAEISGGEPVGQALTVFCRKIIENAKVD